MKYTVGQSIKVIEGFYSEQHYVIVNRLIDKENQVPMYQLAAFNPRRQVIWMPEYNVKVSDYKESELRVSKILKRFTNNRS